jgi:zinc/manganese transport system ATP-binding protein
MAGPPVLSVRDAAVGFGERMLWSGLDLDVAPGEFIAVLGANGTGKTTFLRAVLGLQRLSAGSITLGDAPVRHGDRRIGYIPQQRVFGAGVPMRGVDLVRLGIDGHRFGLPRGAAASRARVRELVGRVGGDDFAHRPVGQLSGGEQQRLRVAQALAGDPSLLVCDEPLLSLDLRNQRVVSDLIDARRRDAGSAVLFVTHDVNPVLEMVDRVLYFAAGRHVIGTVDEVLQTEVLSGLFGSRVEVLRTPSGVFVVGLPEVAHHHDGHEAAGR